jgi:tRNA-Thr(GGU) m(6)t(6)A37 methyltransferase TsaA
MATARPRTARARVRSDAVDTFYDVAPAKADVAEALEGISVGQDIVVITCLHESRRDVLEVHPRGDERLPLARVFAIRSPDRPNPLGLHRVTVLKTEGDQLKVAPLKAIDGTPVVNIKPVLSSLCA